MKSHITKRLNARRIQSYFSFVAPITLSLTLAACGGGNTADQTTNAQSVNNPISSPSAAVIDSAATGSITGFGSVIVNGVKYEDGVATVQIDNKGVDTPATTANLKIGMQVDLKAAGAAAQNIAVASQFRGPVTSVGPANLVLLGQTINVDTTGADAVALEGFADFASIKAGDWVEVYASESTVGVFKASRIERESPLQSTSIRVSGKVSSYDSTAKTFNLGQLKVNLASATIAPAGATIANDNRVRVYSDSAVVAGVVNAKTIRVREDKFEGIRNANVGGVISDFVSLANFTVNGIKIDASKAAIKNGVASDVSAGVAVRVKGAVTNGILTASEVELKKNLNAESAQLSVKGFVTDFVSPSSFKLRGQQIDASKAVFKDGTAAKLGNGSYVEVKLSVVNGALVATSVEFQAAPAGTFDNGFTVSGRINDLSDDKRAFNIAGYNVKISDDALVAQITAASSSNNGTASTSVSIRNNNGTLEVSKVDDSRGSSSSSASASISLSGTVASVNSNQFVLNGLTIGLTPATVFENGTTANLVAGAKISVRITASSNGQYAASKVEIENPQGAAATLEVNITGVVTDYVSKANFKVAGVKVNANSAIFKDGVDADLANGKRVKAEGNVDTTGLLTAKKIEFR
jgi:hypothetical protein